MIPRSPHSGSPLWHAPARAALIVTLATLSGCVTSVYQPLTSLQRPIVVDTEVANFEGLRLLVRCVPGDYVDRAGASLLCRNVATMFRNQGAHVDTDVPRKGREASARDDEVKPDLVIDLKSRLLHEETNPPLRILSILTFTLAPTIEEYSFAQDVTIRDARGALLASDSLQGRIIRYGGFGVWAVNWILDLTVRPDEEELSGDAAKRDFSRDYYGQLTQLAFNARTRQVVLRGFEPVATPTPAGPEN